MLLAVVTGLTIGSGFRLFLKFFDLNSKRITWIRN